MNFVMSFLDILRTHEEKSLVGSPLGFHRDQCQFLNKLEKKSLNHNGLNWSFGVMKFRECVRTGAAGAQTRSFLGHRLLHPQILTHSVPAVHK